MNIITGYDHDEGEKKMWDEVSSSPEYVELMEAFLEKMLYDDSLEKYAITLKNSIDEIDRSLKKAQETLDTITKS